MEKEEIGFVERKNIEDVLEGQIEVLNETKGIVEKYVEELQAIKKKIKTEINDYEARSYLDVMMLDKEMVNKLIKKVKGRLRRLKGMEKDAEFRCRFYETNRQIYGGF